MSAAEGSSRRQARAWTWRGLTLRLPVVLVLVLSATPVRADNCEAMRSAIEAKIRAAGVQTFSLIAVEAGASAPGRVVGRCALGTRQIVYRRGAGAVAAASAAQGRAGPPKTAPPMLTECRDGRVIVSGDCGR